MVLVRTCLSMTLRIYAVLSEIQVIDFGLYRTEIEIKTSRGDFKPRVVLFA